MRTIAAALFICGLLLAGSDGVYFPAPNIVGGLLFAASAIMILRVG
jgi:hypothetical protein